MPHAIIEYSANINSAVIELDAVQVVHDVMLTCGLFQPEAIKTRLHAVNDFMVGVKDRTGSFLYLQVAILTGRTVEQRQALSDALLAALGDALPPIDELTVEIREMDRETYRKYK
jgi:5-carboxymethyl-2-hydroxymuconate isomerase